MILFYGPIPNLKGLIYLEYVLFQKIDSWDLFYSKIFELQKLKKLKIQKNELESSIPPFHQQTLISFNVSQNKLEGPIPETPGLRRLLKSHQRNNTDLCDGLEEYLIQYHLKIHLKHLMKRK